MITFFIWVVSFFAFLPSLGDPSSFFPQGDEIMHIRTIRESLMSGHWILPQVSGFPNPYKPPLLFWLGIASDRLFGVSFFAERLVSAALGASSATLIYLLSKMFHSSGKMSLILAISFVFSFGTWKFSRLVMMEEAMVFFFLFYIYLFLKYDFSKNYSYFLAANFILGIGYLLKGPIIIVYGAIVILSFFLVDFLRNRKGKFQLEFANLLVYIKLIPGFSFALLAPAIWTFYLYFFNENGKDLIKFFLVAENMGKFSAANQSTLRILGGWLLYSLPFTVTFLFGLIEMVKTRIYSPRQRTGRALLISLFLLSLLHLLPSRKDPYYILPFLSVLFFLPSIYFDSEEWLEKINSLSNKLFLGTIIVLALFANLYFWNITLFAICLTILCLMVYFWKKHSLQGIFIINLTIVPMIAFSILQPLQDPKIEDFLTDSSINKLCVVSENPWAAMEMANRLPKINVIYSPPSSAKSICEEADFPLLIFADFFEPEATYDQTHQWFFWQVHREYETKEILELIQDPKSVRFKHPVRFFRRKSV
ncbi:ArnT family glycosyltransferase [Leptospira ilyithenensis]|uniref:Phospholipid carrier-dependent glycosyltransferase n=1 Tax=Leptospira ilyithenensis TaxID=2484901 RepID=A0A4R9LTC3_9LEPT|nr:glycosyltransferase family 39 protein [Leptospira ilyithenensis]TGN13698.1 phospholipid carrier-dependent glycosyltransferase [Leptospira ilyithenensis]